MHATLSQPIALGHTAEVYDWDADHILKLYFDWCPPHWAENETKVACAVVATGIPSCHRRDP